jgi:Tfp pilus assembly protein PilX
MHSGDKPMAGRQRGVVLIVVLAILLAVTLLGTVVMQSATLQMKMVGNSQARQQAFNNAEAILAQAENFLATTTTIDPTNLATRFTANCGNGLCFAGVFDPAPGGQLGCDLGTIPSKEVWESATLNVWKTAGRHVPVTPPNMTEAGGYIIEFRCFIDGSGKVIDDKGDVLFRITARGVSENGDATVMVQSTYRVNMPL